MIICSRCGKNHPDHVNYCDCGQALQPPGMRCRACGGAMTPQVVTTSSYRRGHGCLYTFLFGIFYWTWLLIKWTVKLTIALCYWLFAAWIMMIVAKSKGQTFQHPGWYRSMMQRKGKLYTSQQTVFVCHSCGNRQTA